MLAIYKREMRYFFTGPVGYVFVAIFFAVSAGIFMSLTVQKGADADYLSYFTYIIMLGIIEVPLITMKLISEERKMKTDQLILTAPVSLLGIVMAKFLAAYTLFGGSFVISSIIYYIPLSLYGSPDGAIYLGSVIAVLLIGAAFIAAGEFISSLTENQFIAAFGTIGLILLLVFAQQINNYINSEAIRRIFSAISVTSRYTYFMYGLFDWAALIYYVSLSAAFLFLTVRVFEKRRWS
ncbi:MAG: ABC transporter [Clostridiales bacterium]|nr:ABC transporter [Clostridiales bacterium]